MPVLPSPAPLAMYVPPSLATEPIGDILAGSLRQGDPGREADIVGYVLVRLRPGNRADRWFFVEATYNGPTSYATAVNDLQFARRADRGAFRRIMPVYGNGTAA
jgi:hypothetical protein